MLKRTSEWLSNRPFLFNILRRIIEFNFVSTKRVIKNEFLLTLNYGKTLDVPCGTGEFCMLFGANSYIGIDISQKYVDYAIKKYPRTFYCRNALENGFETSYFDNIIMIGFLHHLDKELVYEALKETARVLKKNGKMLLIEDAPTRSKLNYIGKCLQRYDIGDNIRPAEYYQDILSENFIITRYYPIRSGFWDYSVFVLLPR